MGKFRLSSLLATSSSPGIDAAETKKRNRRSFSALSSSLRSKDVTSNGAAVSAPKNGKAEAAAAPAPAQSTSRMVALAQKIAKETEKLESYMKENNLSMPSFDVDAPTDFPKLPEDVSKIRQEIIHATKELGLLAHGPRESVRRGVWQFLDVLALTAANHYGIGPFVFD
ncbi:hypothetical protein VTK56DRAFT_3512 [Thermocarpiscus australiensis]